MFNFTTFNIEWFTETKELYIGTGGIITSGISTVNNGLTKNGTNIRLGGTFWMLIVLGMVYWILLNLLFQENIKQDGQANRKDLRKYRISEI